MRALSAAVISGKRWLPKIARQGALRTAYFPISVNHDFGVQELAPAISDGKPSDSKTKPVIYRICQVELDNGCLDVTKTSVLVM